VLDWLNNIGHLLALAFAIGVMLLVAGVLLWRRQPKTRAMKLLTALSVTIGLAILLFFAMNWLADVYLMWPRSH
jgi:hypothetical protein